MYTCCLCCFQHSLRVDALLQGQVPVRCRFNQLVCAIHAVHCLDCSQQCLVSLHPFNSYSIELLRIPSGLVTLAGHIEEC
jgi:hypothetical protein